MTSIGGDPSRAYAEVIGRTFSTVLERVVLFGSRSIGDFRDDSDYDIAIFLTNRTSVRTYWKAIANAAYPFVERGCDIRPVILSFERWDEASDFVTHIRRHGTTLL